MEYLESIYKNIGYECIRLSLKELTNLEFSENDERIKQV
jgi:hypothetical protein